MTTDKHWLYLAPWRDRNADGSLGDQYGPSPQSYSRQIARFRLWSWRPSRRREVEAVQRYMLAHAEDVPAGEVTVYCALYEHGMSSREAARELGWSRSTVQTLRRRLLARVAGK